MGMRGHVHGTRPRIVAHRGASSRAPENTVAAVRLALALGVDAVEGDLHRTRDGELVVVHDRHLRRTTNAREVFPGRDPWRVRDFTLAEIKRLDAGAWFSREYAGERIPTLREWAAAVGLGARMLVEVKRPASYPGIGLDLALELRLAPGLSSAVAEGRLVVQSFDHAWVRALVDLAPEVAVGLLYETRPTQRDISWAAGFARHLNPAHRVVTREVVARAQASGLEVHLWTPNSVRHLRRAVACGADGVITDHPDRTL